MNNSYKIWVDTGGTFTDCISISPDNEIKRIKVLSSSRLRGKIIERISRFKVRASTGWGLERNILTGYTFKILGQPFQSTIADFDPAEAILVLDAPLISEDFRGREFEITAFEEAPILAARLATETKLTEDLPQLEMRLGTTKGTNALLERKGSKVCFIVTKGFKDVIEIGSQQRHDLFALNIIKQKPLYDEVIEMEERIDKNGHVLTELSQEEIIRCIEKVKAIQPDSIAIALIHGYKNDVHEMMLRDSLKSAGYEFTSMSSQMAREIKFLPRAQTTIVNAYLDKVIVNYLNSVKSVIKKGSLKVMTSYGGLVDADLFLAKDSLLSGPAGGVVGALKVAEKMEYQKIITFDMGGTSTDVSRVDHNFDYQFETEIDHIPVFSPVISIETVAAGGGSICSFDGFRLTVGPESAGADPGPACYGAGGPLAVTDVNLLLGRLDEGSLGIPLNRAASENALSEIKKQMSGERTNEALLTGFLQIANEKMADAIRKISLRKGHDPKDFALLAFGGAGGQNACALAELLRIQTIIVPFDAGLLSALGMGMADIERFAQKQILKPLDEVLPSIENHFNTLEEEALNQLKAENFSAEECHIKLRQIYLRFEGQESCLEIDYDKSASVREIFKSKYEKIYGHWLENGLIEVESVKTVAAGKREEKETEEQEATNYTPAYARKIRSFVKDSWQEIPVYQWEGLENGAFVTGPALLVSHNSTVFVDQNWQLKLGAGKNAVVNQTVRKESAGISKSEFAELELFTNRFKAIAGDMGAILQRSSFSVNVKERLDFSCAVLDKDGYLVANAPHIPVHLGSLGICVRSVVEELKIGPGDVVITNHPGYGGSHLPDITLIGAAFDENGELIGYVANRAHHAEIGGKTPGSMPPDAVNLSEEGVIISPAYLIRDGKDQWAEIKAILKSARYPSRSIDENIADLNGALASVYSGITELRSLCKNFGTKTVREFMVKLQNYATACVAGAFDKLSSNQWSATEYLDDGTKVRVRITLENERVHFDFTGSSRVHPGNLNATRAIVSSAVLYVLRLMVDEDLPLNEGIMKNVKISIPEGTFLNPTFNKEPVDCPAVVGGNTEVSQRLVDTLIKALELAACSQGTMNNLIFGNEKFGFYETICGGTGAGSGFDGADAVHQHMTNTKITDPEIIEYRYPVRLDKMEIRENSGGSGKWRGGNGVGREITFLDDISISLLTEHRKERPFGLHGGEPGKAGEQFVVRKDGVIVNLKGIDGLRVFPGDKLVIKTPGGGGWGKFE